MNKVVKVILNILIVVASLLFVLSFIFMLSSFKHEDEKKKQEEKETTIRVFEYKLSHVAYGEITSSYFSDRMGEFEAEEGLEETYLLAEYANSAFLARVYEAKGDETRKRTRTEKLEEIRKKLGKYLNAADEIDKILQKSTAS